MNWTYEKCKEEASKYETRSQFYKGNSSAYNASRSNGWLDDFFEKKKWNYKTCREEAKKYRTKKDFSEGCRKAYSVALERNWLQKWFHDARHDKVSQWTEEMCRKEAKKYKTRTEFMKGSPTAYNQSLKNKWIREFDWLKRPESHLKKWTYETCKEEARKYTRRVDFQRGSSGAYRIAYKNEWIKEYDWFEIHQMPSNYWTEEMCLKEAKKYTSKVAFQKGSVTAYQVALRKGWIKDYDWFKRPEPHNKGKIKWTYDKCKAAFEAAWQNGWIEEWLEEKRK